MSMKTFSIDPDVWKASNQNNRCNHVLWEIWENPAYEQLYSIALDNDEVENEYLEIWQSNLNSDVGKILQDIFNKRERSPRVVSVTPYSSPEIQKIIQHHNCGTAVEPALIRMAAAQDGPALTLLLVGTDDIRKRGLHQKGVRRDFRRFFREKLHKTIDIMLASDLWPSKKDELVAGLHTKIFECQVFSILQQKIFDKYQLMPLFKRKAPGQVERIPGAVGKQAGEIDGYLFMQIDMLRHIWICECELREEGNETSPTTEEKMSKLAKKVKSVENYEQTLTNGNIIVKGYLVTNAQDMSADAEKVAQENNLQFVGARMPKGWTEDIHWHLREKDVTNADF